MEGWSWRGGIRPFPRWSDWSSAGCGPQWDKRAKRSGNEEATLRQESVVPCARDALGVAALRAVGILCAEDGSGRAFERVPRKQAEIGKPVREIEVTPIEEPVPDFAPDEEPSESPVEPAREPERVPA